MLFSEGEFLQAYRSTGLRRAILPIQLCMLLVTVLFLQVFGEISLLAPTLDAGFSLSVIPHFFLLRVSLFHVIA